MNIFRWQDPWVLLGSGMYIGFAPIAPGTATSLVVVVLWWFLLAGRSVELQIAVIVLTMTVSVIVINQLISKYEIDDDPKITIDEVVGQSVALLLLPKVVWLFVLALVLFRVFDIVKFGPIRWVEKRFTGAAGVLLDDILAGLFTLAIVQLGALYWVY